MTNIKYRTLLISSLMLATSAFVLSAAVAGPPKKKPAKNKKPATVVKLDIAAGKKTYEANGCGGCHKIGEEGGSNGPELTAVGADVKHTPAWLAVHVGNPKKHKEDSSMPGYADKIKGKDMTNLAGYLASLKGAKK